MRALLFHCKEYGVKIGQIANRPKGIVPEKISEIEQKCKDCIVVLITVEINDDISKASSGLIKELIKMSQDVGHKNIVILPFAHLSNKLAKSEDGIRLVSFVEDNLKSNFNVIRAHFGSHK